MNHLITKIIVLMLILSSFEAGALYSLQKFAKEPKKKIYYILACLIYGFIVTYLLYKNLKYEGIGMVNFFWNVFSTVAGFIIGIYLFKEKVTGIQWMGVALSIVGLWLILSSKN
jgi:drug/metabolite transporter (DMT)-like permease